MFDSSSNNSVSISVTDEESDELTRLRVRSRRKRKKPRVRVVFSKRAFRWLCRYWMVLVLLPAAGLLLFEATRIGMKSKPVVDTELNGMMKPKFSSNSAVSNASKPGVVKKQDTSLNRLDPITRVVAGARERCLKLLPPEELEHLDIPVNEETNGHVKNIAYMSDSSRPNSVSSWQRINNTRFNLFTGNQTFGERERTFKENATTMIHCGFYSENGGFRISEEDKAYMKTCKVVVSTCAFGGGDDLYQPIGMSKASLENVCYVAFWDEITLAAQKVEGREIGETGLIGIWRIVVVHDLPFVDQRLNGKIPKMLSHRLFPHARYSIWVDSKSQFRRDPLGVIEALLWRSNSELAISEHGARSSVYDEAKAVVHKHKATPEEVEVQITQYRLDGLPEDKRFGGKKALCEASVIVRKHTPVTNLIMCVWFNEVVRFTSRDQLSFPYALWRLRVVKNINMFPVCTRKDLVNSMGHIRKAKPLTE